MSFKRERDEEDYSDSYDEEEDDDYEEEENNEIYETIIVLHDNVTKELPGSVDSTKLVEIDDNTVDDIDYGEYAGLLSKINETTEDNTTVDKLTNYQSGLPFCTGDCRINGVNIIDADILFVKLDKLQAVDKAVEDDDSAEAKLIGTGMPIPELKKKLAKVTAMAFKFGMGQFYPETHPVIVKEEKEMIARWVKDDLDQWNEDTCPLCKYGIDPPDPYDDGGQQISKQIALFFLFLIHAIKSTNRVKGFELTANYWNIAIRDGFGRNQVKVEGINRSLIEWHCYHTPDLKRILDQYRKEQLAYLAIDSMQRNGLFFINDNSQRSMTDKAVNAFCKAMKTHDEAADRTFATEMAMIMTGRLQATTGNVTIKTALKILKDNMTNDRFGVKGGNAMSAMIENKHGDSEK